MTIEELERKAGLYDHMLAVCKANGYDSITQAIQPRPTPRYFRHVKTGGLYEFVSQAEVERNLELVVVYRALKDGRTFTRPFAEFFDGRFEEVK